MIATNIQQSNHLLELGLDPKTADMFWKYSASLGNKDINGRIAVSYHDNLFVGKYDGAIPAWSLSALLEVMPSSAYIDCKMKQDGFGYWECVFEYDGNIKVRHRTKQSTSSGKPDPTSTAYAMVVWLLTNNFIEKGGQNDIRTD